jgi:hypothetical protein
VLTNLGLKLEDLRQAILTLLGKAGDLAIPPEAWLRLVAFLGGAAVTVLATGGAANAVFDHAMAFPIGAIFGFIVFLAAVVAFIYLKYSR